MQSQSPSTKNNFFKISSSMKELKTGNQIIQKRIPPLVMATNQSKTSQSQLNQFLKKIKSVNHQIIKNSVLSMDNQVADFSAETKGLEIT